MKRAAIQVAFAMAAVVLAQAALADWDPGDPYKMHFPQLPDTLGWDVSGTSARGGDDWFCTRTGPVSDIHMWLSWRDDVAGAVENITLSIWSNDPVGDGGDPNEDRANTFSMPLEQQWQYSFDPDTDPNVTLRAYAGGLQGWYDPAPVPPVYLPENHNAILQGNLLIPAGQGPFEQQEGEVYWLIAKVTMEADETAELGWKTADLHQYPDTHQDNIFMDGAVYDATGAGDWQMLADPSGAPMDLAFVITPEPATIALMALGTLGLAARAWQRKGRT